MLRPRRQQRQRRPRCFSCRGQTSPATQANEELEPSPTQEPAHAQLTIIYGGRVIVLDDVPEDRAKELVLVASAMPQDMLMARKASLRRFMEKRQDRLAARAPYGASRHDFVSASKKGRQ
ncbi:hypothetical protein EJB05_22583, partial [Eragrostis curvula]